MPNFDASALLRRVPGLTAAAVLCLSAVACGGSDSPADDEPIADGQDTTGCTSALAAGASPLLTQLTSLLTGAGANSAELSAIITSLQNAGAGTGTTSGSGSTAAYQTNVTNTLTSLECGIKQLSNDLGSYTNGDGSTTPEESEVGFELEELLATIDGLQAQIPGSSPSSPLSFTALAAQLQTLTGDLPALLKQISPESGDTDFTRLTSGITTQLSGLSTLFTQLGAGGVSGTTLTAQLTALLARLALPT